MSSKKPRVANASFLQSLHREKTGTCSDVLYVIHGFLAFIKSLRSRFTLQCLLRSLPVSLLQYFVKNWTWFIFEDYRVPLGTAIMQRFTNVSSLRAYHSKRTWTRAIRDNLRNPLWGLYIGLFRLHICAFKDRVLYILVFLLQVELEKSVISRKFLRVLGWLIWPTEREGE